MAAFRCEGHSAAAVCGSYTSGAAVMSRLVVLEV